MNSNYPREDAVGGLAARRRRDTLECKRKGARDIRLSIGASTARQDLAQGLSVQAAGHPTTGSPQAFSTRAPPMGGRRQ